MYYAGIGSRKAPDEILQTMIVIAKHLANHGYTLRSGGAIGSDTAFEQGCDLVKGKKEIWLPKINNNTKEYNRYPTKQHMELVSKVHPVWDKLSDFAKALHARNSGQVLGEDLNTPVDFVVCWTPDGCEHHNTRKKDTGGTGTAISVASQRNISIYNLANKVSKETLIKKLLQLDKKPEIKILNKYKDQPTTKTIYIGRGSPLGNPYPITKEHPRLEVIAKYREYLTICLLDDNPVIINGLKQIKSESQLMCFCAPAPCHGEVIREIWLELNKTGDFEEGLKNFKAKYAKNTLEFSPSRDGVDHINIYSKANTSLGRDLSNFADIGFKHPDYGQFRTVEGFWYYVSTGFKYEQLRTMSGPEAKKFGKEIPKVPIDCFEGLIISAIQAKISQSPELYLNLKNSILPFTHYYYYGNIDNPKVIFPKGAEFIVEYLTKFRSLIQSDII